MLAASSAAGDDAVVSANWYDITIHGTAGVGLRSGSGGAASDWVTTS